MIERAFISPNSAGTAAERNIHEKNRIYLIEHAKSLLNKIAV
jgi:hypothetical protein